MTKYVIVGNQATVTSSYKTGASGANPSSGTLRRGRVAELIFGFSANPNATDTYGQFDLSLTTAAGTSTGFTPNPEDGADGAAITVGGINHTVEPTYTATSSRFNDAINQRSTMRWQEIDGSMMPIWPATASNGIGLRVQSATYAASVTTQIGYLE